MTIVQLFSAENIFMIQQKNFWFGWKGIRPLSVDLTCYRFQGDFVFCYRFVPVNFTSINLSSTACNHSNDSSESFNVISLWQWLMRGLIKKLCTQKVLITDKLKFFHSSHRHHLQKDAKFKFMFHNCITSFLTCLQFLFRLLMVLRVPNGSGKDRLRWKFKYF